MVTLTESKRVHNVTSLGKNGVQDFILLRASSVVIAAYALFMSLWFAFAGELSYETLTGLFSGLGVKTFTLLALVAVLIHVWIGLWQVLTDYVKPVFLRGVLQFGLALIGLGYLLAGLVILWGV